MEKVECPSCKKRTCKYETETWIFYYCGCIEDKLVSDDSTNQTETNANNLTPE